MKTVKMAVIGHGNRGRGLLKDILLNMADVEVIGVCDLYPDRAEAAADRVEQKTGKRPFSTVDHHEILKMKALDAVLVSTSWETHVEVAIDAMKAGIPVALEVGGAYSVEKLWEMVRVQENTRVPLMMMENCCFGKTELLGTSLLRNGLLGELVHAHGCYGHYLCEEIAGGNVNRHYRLRNYLSRNCENYPTHELGPIAKALNINRGNQMISLVSVSSKACGMKDYINRHADKYPELVGKEFRQGDIVNTIITCADGSTITLRLDTTLPRSYAREFTLRGTRGLYEQATNSVYLDGEKEYWETDEYYRAVNNNAARFEADYLPDVWRNITPEDIASGHGGMDGIEFRVFVDALKNGTEMPIDVYDAAAWMSITALSAASIAAGGMPQAIPDFTGGLWTVRPPRDVVELPIVK
ncbi:MAG: Gfo/Idh/MocA family oxidoreductase [Clostridia bacterium]|nr:Gfo/Idh/MocA family oxidoreductase [Clostridia bacterium]MBQ9785815.1 Gfo/Idh/MocA family oxidoreductase [Clostridia bacterium]